MASPVAPSPTPIIPATNTVAIPVGPGTSSQTSGPVASQPQAGTLESTPLIACPTTKAGFALGQFDERSQGDFLVKSSDGIKFRVHIVVLKLASSVWQDMFDLPQPLTHDEPLSSDELQKLPTIELSEPSTTLSALFRLLYPKGKSQIQTFDLAFKLMDAYHKYDIDISGLVPFFSDLMSTWSIQANPLEVYGLAWRVKNADVVNLASRYLHDISLEKRDKDERVLRYSGDFAALSELYHLRLKRELALDSFVEGLPLSDYRCWSHKDLSSKETKKLRMASRRALAVADPKCQDVVQFFNLQEVFSHVACGRKAACQACEKALASSKDGLNCSKVNDAIATFPQGVSRTGEDLHTSRVHSDTQKRLG
ncbi:hypothetical protein M407DRAFT_29740 [Tulasnella calospora MUT 4182]|uniref:BTB domain-containing protein n=1 Tax=Tulasnella calospora MUT 4182 TaxID=1051891 RepID=A0A0C3Q8I7_9AGAM|nr:hypothetical protein M407DRAFT_29740 [Tulasnella calospora MUT 4182]